MSRLSRPAPAGVVVVERDATRRRARCDGNTWTATLDGAVVGTIEAIMKDVGTARRPRWVVTGYCARVTGERGLTLGAKGESEWDRRSLGTAKLWLKVMADPTI